MAQLPTNPEQAGEDITGVRTVPTRPAGSIPTQPVATKPVPTRPTSKFPTEPGTSKGVPTRPPLSKFPNEPNIVPTRPPSTALPGLGTTKSIPTRPPSAQGALPGAGTAVRSVPSRPSGWNIQE